MGYSSQSKGQIAPKTLANLLERKTQLYTPSFLGENYRSGQELPRPARGIN